MPLHIALVTSPHEFDEICPMDFDAWQTPYNPQLKHFRPNLPTREEAIAYKRDKSVKQLTVPNRFTVKVTDDATDEVIGCAVWAINNPEKEEDGNGKVVASWHPEGSEEKEFAEVFINGLWRFLGERVTRKHMGMYIPLLLESLCLTLSLIVV